MADTHGPRSGSPPVPEGNVWSVGRLNAEIGSVLDAAQDRLPSYVIGEISDVNRYEFGTFFDLRDVDGEATISCIMWAHQREAVTHELEDGTETIVRATVDFYQDDGRTQLAVKNFWPVGESDRSEDLAALRAELSAEGLLDEAARQPLPEYPRHIGVVTSLSGSARHDFQQAVRARHPGVPITVCGATVQGEAAVTSLVTAVQRVENDPAIDVIVVTRGGGADADLWCFNEEPVVRAIADCATPTVVAVGHEDDETLAEAVADHRTMTPTDAGVAVAPDLAAVRQRVADIEHRVDRAYTSVVTDRVAAITQRLDAGLQAVAQRTQARAATRQRTADLEHRITVAYEALVTSRLTAIETQLNDAFQALEHAVETDAVTARAARRRVQGLESRIDTAYQTHLDRELGALETRIEQGYREVKTDTRVQASRREVRRLRVAVILLLVVLGVTLLGVAVGVL